MSEKQPTLSVSRPLAGINEEHITQLRGEFVNLGVSEEADLQDLFHSAKGLRAAIISPGEIQILYARLGRTPNVEEIRELGNYIDQGLAAAGSGDIDPIPVLPSEVQSFKTKSRRKVLTVASSEAVFVERVIAQNAVRNFLKLKQIPPRVWFNDKYVARAHLAHGNNARSVTMLGRLEGLLNGKKLTSLPNYAQVKPVNIAILDESHSAVRRGK